MRNKIAWNAFLCLLAGAFVFLSAVADAKEIAIYQRTDDFKGFTVYFTAPELLKLEGGSFLSERYVSMSLHASTSFSDASKPYVLEVDADLPGWMFIDNGESLVLKLDGNVLPLSGSGSGVGGGDRDIKLNGVSETSYYRLSLEMLQKIAAAKSIQFRIYGTENQITGEFTEPMMTSVRLFANQVPTLIRDPLFAGSASQMATPEVVPASVPLEFGAEFSDAWKFVLKMDAKVLGVPELHGVTVSRVASDSVAGRAGIKSSDLIFEFDGKSFENSDALRSLIGTVRSGETVDVGVMRARAGRKSEVIHLQAKF